MKRGPNLYRREPVDIDVRYDLLGKIERHEGHIFVAVQMFLSSRDDCLGACFDQVIHDGKIVRRKIPKNVDVVLEKT